jgi:hypothetical protein
MVSYVLKLDLDPRLLQEVGDLINENRLVNGDKRLVDGDKILVNGVQRLINGDKILVNGVQRLIK